MKWYLALFLVSSGLVDIAFARTEPLATQHKKRELVTKKRVYEDRDSFTKIKAVESFDGKRVLAKRRAGSAVVKTEEFTEPEEELTPRAQDREPEAEPDREVELYDAETIARVKNVQPFRKRLIKKYTGRGVRQRDYPRTLPQEKDIVVFFAPQDDCTGAIIECIDNAQDELYVMAYALVCPKILRALCNAIDRGVGVRILLDASYEFKPQLSELKEIGVKSMQARGAIVFGASQQGALMIDATPRIAHNKIMLMKNKNGRPFSVLVITGSFNFSVSARSNAENVAIVFERALLYEQYLENWMWRRKLPQTREAAFSELGAQA